MHLKDLPLSTQVFEDVITSKSLYIDKTTYIHKLIIRGLDEKTGAVACPKYFLSRPRRFGKSMTISTLKAIFEGKKALFEDLFLSNTSYKFHTYPILHLDFSILGKTPETLRHSLLSKLDDFAKNFRVSFSGKTSISEKTEALLLGIGQKSVVLIDEYDAPILDALKESNEAIRTQNVKTLSMFYAIFTWFLRPVMLSCALFLSQESVSSARYLYFQALII